jgi:hypothetical protein
MPTVIADCCRFHIKLLKNVASANDSHSWLLDDWRQASTLLLVVGTTSPDGWNFQAMQIARGIRFRPSWALIFTLSYHMQQLCSQLSQLTNFHMNLLPSYIQLLDYMFLQDYQTKALRQMACCKIINNYYLCHCHWNTSIIKTPAAPTTLLVHLLQQYCLPEQLFHQLVATHVFSLALMQIHTWPNTFYYHWSYLKVLVIERSSKCSSHK